MAAELVESTQEWSGLNVSVRTRVIWWQLRLQCPLAVISRCIYQELVLCTYNARFYLQRCTARDVTTAVLQGHTMLMCNL